VTAPDNDHLDDDVPRRAIDDPVTLAKAARIFRVALTRGHLPVPEDNDDGEQ
jgi:hypothetical protein